MAQEHKSRIFIMYDASGRIIGVWSGSQDQEPFVRPGVLLLEVESVDLNALRKASVKNGALVNG